MSDKGIADELSGPHVWSRSMAVDTWSFKANVDRLLTVVELGSPGQLIDISALSSIQANTGFIQTRCTAMACKYF